MSKVFIALLEVDVVSLMVLLKSIWDPDSL